MTPFEMGRSAASDRWIDGTEYPQYRRRRKDRASACRYSMPAAANKLFAADVVRNWINASAASDFDSRAAI